ncbi:hypothetical protein PCLA_18r0080 [Pseudomonas citronellolis]|nr:hypothetical protein PCLA_18r0080 [Pseudomonas citronellolis]
MRGAAATRLCTGMSSVARQGRGTAGSRRVCRCCLLLVPRVRGDDGGGW